MKQTDACGSAFDALGSGAFTGFGIGLVVDGGRHLRRTGGGPASA